MSPADRALVGPLAWTPQQKAQYDVAFFRRLARDRQAQRVYLAKVRIVETVRAKAPAQLCGGCKDNNLCKGAGRAGARSLGRNGPPTGAAAENRKRRKKSEAQRQKGAQKLQHRWLQRRCEAAAAKPGGSPPKILARVLACCGRFFELLLPEGAERMQRLRDEQQAQSKAMQVDAAEVGLDAMRRALAAVWQRWKTRRSHHVQRGPRQWILARRKARWSNPRTAVGRRRWQSRLRRLRWAATGRLAWPAPELVGDDADPTTPLITGSSNNHSNHGSE